MRHKTRAPISSFGPEILAALLQGSRKEIRIGLSYREAVRMRQRLYQLRQRMKEENHEAYLAVSRCFITIEWNPAVEESSNSKNVRFPKNRSTPSTLVLRPQDSEFTQALSRAGVESNELLTPTLPSPGVPAQPEDDVLANYLKPSGGQK